jgi:peroxiredoxin Q/BCP
MNEGDQVPDFDLPDQDGAHRRLSTMLKDGPVVLFFYPAALTAGCTAETCHFRDLATEFAAAGAQRIGISPDTVDKQQQFALKHSFDFPLLADTDRQVAELFGVKRKHGFSPVKRTTFVIGTDQKVRAVIHSEFSMEKHADEALAALR